MMNTFVAALESAVENGDEIRVYIGNSSAIMATIIPETIDVGETTVTITFNAVDILVVNTQGICNPEEGIFVTEDIVLEF